MTVERQRRSNHFRTKRGLRSDDTLTDTCITGQDFFLNLSKRTDRTNHLRRHHQVEAGAFVYLGVLRAFTAAVAAVAGNSTSQMLAAQIALRVANSLFISLHQAHKRRREKTLDEIASQVGPFWNSLHRLASRSSTPSGNS